LKFWIHPFLFFFALKTNYIIKKGRSIIHFLFFIKKIFTLYRTKNYQFLRPKTTEQVRRKTGRVFLGCDMLHKTETRMLHKSDSREDDTKRCSKLKLGC